MRLNLLGVKKLRTALPPKENKIVWLDSRLYHPPTSFYKEYLCLYIGDNKLPKVEMVAFIPNDGYKSGKWGREILYFTMFDECIYEPCQQAYSSDGELSF